MGKNVGWEKLERGLLESILWDRNEPFDDRSAYIDLRLRANFADTEFNPFGNEVITVHAKEIFTSIKKLAQHWGWSVNRVRRYLLFLEKAHLAEVKRHTYGTTITLMNIDENGNRRHTNEYADEPTNEYANEHANGYAGGYADGPHNKKDKKVKKDKEDSKRNQEYAKRWNDLWGGEPE